jgi:hypothetical protein
MRGKAMNDSHPGGELNVAGGRAGGGEFRGKSKPWAGPVKTATHCFKVVISLPRFRDRVQY